MPTVDYLRISLIDRCNFRCTYCMPAGTEVPQVWPQDWLTDGELLTLVSEVFVPLGFRRFRLTGGEPLLRPNLAQLVAQLAGRPGVADLSLTTNGSRLADLAVPLYQAGLRRVNISFDSLNPETFAHLSGGRPGSAEDRWQRVWAGILAAHQAGFDPLKLNVVVVPGVNDAEVLDLAALTLERAWHVRFIEFMPIGNEALFGERGWVNSEDLRHCIRQQWGLEPAQVTGAGPADVWRIPGALGTLGFIGQMSECFCDRCNRVRLSADGWLRPCLLNETGQINLRQGLRSGQPLAHLKAGVAQVLALKPEISFKERDRGTQDGVYRRTMSQIGG